MRPRAASGGMGRWLFICLLFLVEHVQALTPPTPPMALHRLRHRTFLIQSDETEAALGLLTGQSVVDTKNLNITDIGSTATDLGDVAMQVFNTTEQLWVTGSDYGGLGLLAGLGALLLLFGYRLLKVTLFLGGFWFAFAIIFIFTRTYTTLEYKWCLVSGLGCGVIGGIVAVFVLKVGLFVLGAFLGFWVGTCLLSFPITINGAKQTLLQQLSQRWHYYAIMAAFCLVFGLLALCDRMQKFLIILTTSLGGAFCLCCFIDKWTETGFSLAAKTVLALMTKGEDIYSVPIKTSVIGLLIGCAALCVAGMIFQYWSLRRASNNSGGANKGEDDV